MAKVEDQAAFLKKQAHGNILEQKRMLFTSFRSI